MSDHEITGPVEARRVIVNGQRGLFAEAFPGAGATISLVLDSGRDGRGTDKGSP